MKVLPNGEIKKVKSMPKYYQPRITWVEITPKLANKYLKNSISWRKATEIGKSIRYSTESIHKVFRNPPKRVNKVIWDAITAFLDVKEP